MYANEIIREAQNCSFEILKSCLIVGIVFRCVEYPSMDAAILKTTQQPGRTRKERVLVHRQLLLCLALKSSFESKMSF